MSEENVELVRRLLGMFADRDHEAVFAFYDPEIEWIAGPGHADFQQGTYRGHEGVRAYWRGWLQAWKDLDFEVQDIFDAGDDVVALICNQHQSGRRSGIRTEVAPYGLVFTFRDGKVVRWRSFADQQAALDAVDLRA